MNNTNRTLNEWLSWMEQNHPTEIELGLERIGHVAERLPIDLSGTTVVTVGGTNGKGTTISYLRNIYQSAGYRVGCYTSPHFLHYNERVQINGESVTDEQLCAAFALIDQARGEISLTYFEFGTLAALVILSQEEPDLVLLEVGLGGRLDGVNIIDADLAIVTTIALDHTDWLGDTREKIGYEKAGIFRAGKLAICGDLNPPVTIAETAAEKGSVLLQAGESFCYQRGEGSWNWQGETREGQRIEFNDLPLPHLPLQNAATALQACELIDLTLNEDAIRKGIKNASLMGRMQQAEYQGLNLWLDVAHNPEAAQHLRDEIVRLQRPVTLVLGMLADKDCKTVVETLLPVVSACYLVSLDVPRGQRAEDLEKFLPAGSEAVCCADIESALKRLKSDANVASDVIIAGSFFTVSDALALL